MPVLSSKQIASFRPITPEEHARFKNGIVRKVGRPKKDIDEKENPTPIRMSNKMIRDLKRVAFMKGYTGWQTYAKKVLLAEIAKAGRH